MGWVHLILFPAPALGWSSCRAPGFQWGMVFGNQDLWVDGLVATRVSSLPGLWVDKPKNTHTHTWSVCLPVCIKPWVHSPSCLLFWSDTGPSCLFCFLNSERPKSHFEQMYSFARFYWTQCVLKIATHADPRVKQAIHADGAVGVTL
jgi:hypothetical protein